MCPFQDLSTLALAFVFNLSTLEGTVGTCYRYYFYLCFTNFGRTSSIDHGCGLGSVRIVTLPTHTPLTVMLGPGVPVADRFIRKMCSTNVSSPQLVLLSTAWETFSVKEGNVRFFGRTPRVQMEGNARRQSTM